MRRLLSKAHRLLELNLLSVAVSMSMTLASLMSSVLGSSQECLRADK